MYENIVIDETSVYEVDEQCRQCQNNYKSSDKNRIMNIQAGENKDKID